MKRSSLAVTRNLAPLRIDLDEFYELAQFLAQHFQEVFIEADEFTLEKPEEIEELRKEGRRSVRKLHVTCFERRAGSPYAGLHFSPTLGAQVIVTSDDEDKVKALGLLENLVIIVSRNHKIAPRLRPLTALTYLWLALALMAAVLTLSQVAYLVGYRHSIKWLLSPWLAFLCTILLAIWLATLRVISRPGILFLRRRSERGGFFARHKEFIEKALLVLLGVVLGAVLNPLGQWLVRQVTGPATPGK